MTHACLIDDVRRKKYLSSLVSRSLFNPVEYRVSGVAFDLVGQIKIVHVAFLRFQEG